ncbi:MAG: FAD binding domain-containing protein [Candidatus Cloacimonetes bacterium]|nr:FAD binding domain-containing protein [Candidatus Cloacimonadota bacterium]
MKFHKPQTLPECLCLLGKLKDPWLLAGGTDINVQIRHQLNVKEDVVFINHLPELNFIKKEENSLIIGATATIKDISGSELIKKECPFLADSLADFASPLISNLATIAGNIANSSPTADTVPLLLVLEAALVLSSCRGHRTIALKDFYTSYKHNVRQTDEMITSIIIPLLPPDSYTAHYVKIGSRRALTIAKAALALLKRQDEFRIAAGSLSEYPKRLKNVEEYLQNSKKIVKKHLFAALDEDVYPISDFRSEAAYRLQVTRNYLLKFTR